MYEKGPRLSRTEIPPMITDSNQACMAKMIGRRVQEVTHAMELKVPCSPMTQYLPKTEIHLEGRRMIDMIFE
jgi:hypothetical protein